MREIVDRILQEEQSARSKVERAQNQSQDIIRKAKEEALSLIQDTVNKAKDAVKSKKEAAEKGFLVERNNIIKEAKDSASLSRNQKSKDIPKIAGDIFSKIITIKG